MSKKPFKTLGKLLSFLASKNQIPDFSGKSLLYPLPLLENRKGALYSPKGAPSQSCAFSNISTPFEYIRLSAFKAAGISVF